MIKKRINLLGAGGHAKVIIDILKSQNKEINKIFDQDTTIVKHLDFSVIHDLESIESPLIISIGNNLTRKKIVGFLKNVEYDIALSKTAIISEKCDIGIGTVVMQGAIIQSSAKLGEHVIINTGATIDHDCIIHSYAHIAPGANLCGNVEIGEGALIGAGSVIIPGVRVGNWTTIGAGSIVINDIPDNVIAMGNPCKILKINNHYEH